jgi:hypothetical protein
MNYENPQPHSKEEQQAETLFAMEKVLIDRQDEHVQTDTLYVIFGEYIDQGGDFDTFRPQFIALCENLNLRTNFKAALVEGFKLLAGTPKSNNR